MDDIFNRLKEPFDPKDLEFRVGRTTKDKSKGLVFTYVTSRAIMDRLDSVLGPTEWQNEVKIHEDGVVATLTLRVGGEWIMRQDGAQYTNIESFKGGISDALKRVAVLFGIGRYLYTLPQTWVDLDNGRIAGSAIKKLRKEMANFAGSYTSVGGEFPGKYAKKETTKTPKEEGVTGIPLDNMAILSAEDLPPVDEESVSVKDKVAENVAKHKEVDYSESPPVQATREYDLPDPIESTMEQLGAKEVNPKHTDGPPQTPGQSKMIGWLCSNMDTKVQDWEDEWVEEFGPRNTWKLLPKFAAIKFIDRLKTKAISVGAWKQR